MHTPRVVRTGGELVHGDRPGGSEGAVPADRADEEVAVGRRLQFVRLAPEADPLDDGAAVRERRRRKEVGLGRTRIVEQSRDLVIPDSGWPW